MVDDLIEDDWTKHFFFVLSVTCWNWPCASGEEECVLYSVSMLQLSFFRCVYLSLWICGSFVADSQGLWTDAHQCDRAPQWQLPSAAGPWPVPRCLRRWSSLSAHCFFVYCWGCEYARHSMNRSTVLWLWPKAFKAQCMRTWASAVQGDSRAFLVLGCWVVLIVSLWLPASSPFKALYTQW